MMRWLDNLSIRKKFIVTSSVTIIFLIFISGYSIKNLWTIKNNNLAGDTTTRTAVMARDIQLDFAELRRLLAIAIYASDSQRILDEIPGLAVKIREAAVGLAATSSTPDVARFTQEIVEATERFDANLKRFQTLALSKSVGFEQTIIPLGDDLATNFASYGLIMGTLRNLEGLMAASSVAITFDGVDSPVRSMFLSRVFDGRAEILKPLSAIPEQLKEMLVAAPDHPEYEGRVRGDLEKLARYQQAIETTANDLSAANDLFQRMTEEDAVAIAAKLDKLSDFLEQSRRETAESTATSIDNASNVTLFIGGGAIVLGSLLSLLVGGLMARPIVRMTEVMRRLAERDWQTDVPGLDQRDEIGAMARSVQVLKEAGIERDILSRGAEQARSAAMERAEQVTKAVARFEGVIAEVVGTVLRATEDLHGNADSMRVVAEETARQSTAVAAAATQTACSVQRVAAASDELAASAGEIGRQVVQSVTMSDRVVDEAKQSMAIIGRLEQAAKEIGAVIQVIEVVASQTHLLALNAQIEAHRAGEFGVGFAVVASEVKALANQTASATEGITAQVVAMQSCTEEAVKTLNQILTGIRDVSRFTGSVAAAVEEQVAATAEIARSVEHAAMGTGDVTNGITLVQRVAGNAEDACIQVLDAVEKLTTQAGRLRREVETFLGDFKETDLAA